MTTQGRGLAWGVQTLFFEFSPVASCVCCPSRWTSVVHRHLENWEYLFHAPAWLKCSNNVLWIFSDTKTCVCCCSRSWGEPLLAGAAICQYEEMMSLNCTWHKCSVSDARKNTPQGKGRRKIIESLSHFFTLGHQQAVHARSLSAKIQTQSSDNPFLTFNTSLSRSLQGKAGSAAGTAAACG